MEEERGVSPALGALLVLAVLMIVLPIFYVTYERRAVYRAEAKHMNEVMDKFIELKSRIEELGEGESTSVNIPMAAGPTPTPIPLFPGPLQRPAPVSASTLIVEDAGGGKVIFVSNNRVYPDLYMVYEGGAIINVRGENFSMLAPPAIVSVKDNEFPKIEVYTVEYRITKGLGSVSRSSPATLRVKNDGVRYDPEGALLKRITFTMTSDYLENAWWDYFVSENRRLAKAGYRPEIVQNPENIELKIEGKKTYDTLDIIYFHEIVELEVVVGWGLE